MYRGAKIRIHIFTNGRQIWYTTHPHWNPPGLSSGGGGAWFESAGGVSKIYFLKIDKYFKFQNLF